ncbi:transposase [Streptomyces sp. F001]|uniref:transposase n=1 Tax=Streptomyces sp. F001 TaxID=1510026 RepID=UPI001F0D698E|nr:transposase [Streptomyces sp. F001]
MVTVPPRNTSRRCPRCLVPLRHRKAPDRPTTPGWKWALCPNPECGWQGDRDMGAWLGVPPLGEHRRPRPDPPDQDRHRPRQRRHGHPQRGRRTRSHRGGRTGHPTHSPRPVQDRAHPAPHPTPRAQATQGTLPHRPLGPGRQASGGTRTTGPDAAAPRSPPAPGRDDDQHTHHPPAQAPRGGTGRRIPPARPRHPTTVENDPTDPTTCGSHRIT